MRSLRRIYRITAILLWDSILFFIAFPAVFMKRDAAIRRNSKIVGLWARGVLAIMGIKVIVEGRAPEFGSVLIVSNHIGYVDVAVNASLAGVRFAAKDDIRAWPFMNALVGISFPVWIDRKNRVKSSAVLEEFKRTLRLGVPLIVYPEGTTTDGKHGLLPFKSTSFEAVAGTDFKICPVLLEYSVPEGEMNPGWYDDTPFAEHIWKFLGISSITARVRCLDAFTPLPDEDRKHLAGRTRGIMLEAQNRQES